MARFGAVVCGAAGPALGAGLCALALYLWTAAPGLTWAHHGADGGDLLAAALTRGVPHPPGYPTYQVLLAAAVRLVPHNPARAGNLLSAGCAAAAAALLADLARRTMIGPAARRRGVIALGVGLTWAASPGLWRQAIITEVYALNALAFVAVLWLLQRSREATGRSARGWLAGAGLAFGLGLGNHLTLALLLPGLAVSFSAEWAAGRARRAAAGERPRAREPVAGCCAFLAACLAGLTIYAYLPWAAAGKPPINWGDASTVAGFRWLVGAEIYRGLVFGTPTAYLPQRLAAWGSEAGGQFGGGPWGMALALAGLWRLEQADRRRWWTTTFIALAYTAYSIGYNAADSDVYLLPAWAVTCLWLGEGLAWLAPRATAWRGPRWGAVIVWLLAVGLPLASVVRWQGEVNLRHERAAEEFLAETAQVAERNAIILVGGDRVTFALWYDRYGRGQRPDLTPINVHLYDYGWYQAALLRYHPQLAVVTHDGRLPPIEQFVREAAQHWPLYRGDALTPVETGLHERAEGVLVRLFAP